MGNTRTACQLQPLKNDLAQALCDQGTCTHAGKGVGVAGVSVVRGGRGSTSPSPAAQTVHTLLHALHTCSKAAVQRVVHVQRPAHHRPSLRRLLNSPPQGLRQLCRTPILRPPSPVTAATHVSYFAPAASTSGVTIASSAAASLAVVAVEPSTTAWMLLVLLRLLLVLLVLPVLRCPTLHARRPHTLPAPDRLIPGLRLAPLFTF